MRPYTIKEGVGLHFFTFSVVDWLPVFVSEANCLIITDSLNFCHKRHELRIHAYVIMPTHLHLIAFDQDFDNGQLKKAIREFRKFTGRSMADYCRWKMPKCYGDGVLASDNGDRKRQFWQPDPHVVGIFSYPFYRTKIDYLHDNPRRKGLVNNGEDWRFSSASFWASGGKIENVVILSAVEW